MKQKLKLFIICLTILGGYYFYDYTNLKDSSILFFSDKFLFLIIIVIFLSLIFYINTFFKNKGKRFELKYRDKLFNALVENSNTVYFMYDVFNKKVLYMTKNIKEVLDFDNIETEEAGFKLIKDLFKNPIIKEEFDKWDKKSELVSKMISYRYDGSETKWIRVKIYPFLEKKARYQIISIANVNKEHEQQHLLIIQAKDIKTREKQLNQITSLAYDNEININVLTGEFKLKNLKENISYFGLSRNGNYEQGLIKILDDYINQEDHEKVLENLSLSNFKKIISEGNLDSYSVRYRLLNKEESTWLESTVFFLTSKGENKVIILTKNVTENAEYMRNQNNLLQGTLQELENANQAKSEFLAIISHQIRTQMNAIIGLSESVMTENLSVAAREDVSHINGASNNLLEILDEILDISKIEAGIFEKNEKEYDTLQLFRTLIGLTKERIGKKKIKFITDINPEIPRELFGDSSKIRQILLNVLTNAVQYTNQGSIILKAEAIKKNRNAEMIITIEDTGEGILKEELNKIFENSKEINYSQHMGLSIVKRLVELLKGKIIVESEYGKGSKFTITFIQKILDEKGIGKIDEYAIEKRKKDYFNARGKKVLVIDDNDLSLKVATRFLEPYGVELKCVDSGQKGIDLVKKGEQFDLILLDQMMPELDGVGTLKELKKISTFKTPVIVTTADAIVGVKEKYLKEGFDDYLSKPIKTDELKELMKKYLREK